eukprot:2093733-Amphidinium_carterae.1
MADSCSNLAKACLRVHCAGGSWTPARLQKHGMQEHSVCRLCGTESADVGHRVFWCPAWHQSRFHMVPGPTRTWLGGLSEEVRLGLAVGRIPADSFIVPAAKDELICQVGRAGFLEGDIFTDGSVVRPLDEEGRRGGWSLVQMSGEKMIRAFFGRLPLQAGPGQTPPEAEDYAISKLLDLARGDLRVHTDCQSTYNLLLAGEAGSKWKASARSHIWKRVWQYQGALVPVKVLAHRPRSEFQSSEALRGLWWGNHWADRWAQKGATLHPGGVTQVRDLEEAERHCCHLLRFVRWQAEQIALHDECKDCLVPQPLEERAALRGTPRGPRRRHRKRRPWLAPEWVKDLAAAAPERARYKQRGVQRPPQVGQVGLTGVSQETVNRIRAQLHASHDWHCFEVRDADEGDCGYLFACTACGSYVVQRAAHVRRA